jgi:hypothetical protein
MEKQPRVGTFQTKSCDLIFEKFFDEYITVWYKEHCIFPTVFNKAKREIDFLKHMTHIKMEKNAEV